MADKLLGAEASEPRLKDLLASGRLSQYRSRNSALVDRERGGVRPLKPAAPGKPPAGRPAETATDRPYDDPYFWAAFILVGDPE